MLRQIRRNDLLGEDCTKKYKKEVAITETEGINIAVTITS